MPTQKNLNSNTSPLLDIIYQQEKDLEQLKQQLAVAEKTLVHKNSIIDGLSHHIGLEQQTQNKLLNSTSWKLTYPVRRLKHFLIPLSHLTRTIYHKPGIMLSWFKKYPQLVKHKGILSIIQYINTRPFKHTLNDTESTDSRIVPYTEQLNREDYHQWYQKYYSLKDNTVNKIKNEIAQWDRLPLISIIMPVYNTGAEDLTDSIQSVREQIYPNWQLCICDDASSENYIKPLLQEFQQKDQRIEVVFKHTNGHISSASNAAIKLATGDYIAFLDHDDLLTRDALYWVVKKLIAEPQTQLIYSDEDRLDLSGHLVTPYFKPDWNPDLFLSHHYLTHFAVYNKKMIDQVGGLRTGYEGAQDYDLALRVTEKLTPQQIQHIARVLYHWRITPQSTSSGLQAKPYAFTAGQKALNDYLVRNHLQADAVEAPHASGNYRIKYHLPDKHPLASLIIPTYNQYRLLRQCIDSIIEKTDYPEYEIIIVDNNSDDPVTLEYLKVISQQNNIRVLRYPHEFNYSAINNYAVKQASGSIIGLLNNDIEVINNDWLSEMVSLAVRPGTGAVGAKLYYPNNTLQHAGIILGIGGVAGHSHKGFAKESSGHVNRTLLLQNFSGVTAACMILPKKVFTEVGGFDEQYLKIAFNDVDLNCKITRAGYRIVWTPYAELYHHESASRGYEDTPEKKIRMKYEMDVMKKRWGHRLLENDPNYNPNLTLKHEDFSLATPPRIAFVSSNTSIPEPELCSKNII